MTRLLVLGGSRFVGRAIAETALARGWRVTTFNDDAAERQPQGAEHLAGDRTRAHDLQALRSATWDLAVDTWQGQAEAIHSATAALAGRVGHYSLISSIAVYAWPAPRPLGESAPLLSRPAGAARVDYAARKLDGERAAERLGARTLIARAGLVLGPHEYAGRLAHWLTRLSSHVEVLAPGRPERPVQLVDARDLAAFVLACGERDADGVHNLACPRGHATMGGLLEAARRAAGARAELRWVDEDWLLEQGVEPWTELPLWVPEQDPGAGAYDLDVSSAVAAGAHFRPVEQTVQDTWSWLQASGARSLEARPRLARAREEQLLAAWRERRGGFANPY